MPPTLPNISRAEALADKAASGTTVLNLDVKNLDCVSLTADQATFKQLKIDSLEGLTNAVSIPNLNVESLHVNNPSDTVSKITLGTDTLNAPVQYDTSTSRLQLGNSSQVGGSKILEIDSQAVYINGELVVKDRVNGRPFVLTSATALGDFFFLCDTTTDQNNPFFVANSNGGQITVSNPFTIGKDGLRQPFMNINSVSQSMFFNYVGTTRRHARANPKFMEVDSESGVVTVDDLAVNNHIDTYTLKVHNELKVNGALLAQSIGMEESGSPIPKLNFTPAETTVYGNLGVMGSLNSLGPIAAQSIAYFDGTVAIPRILFTPFSTMIMGNVNMESVAVPVITDLTGATRIDVSGMSNMIYGDTEIVSGDLYTSTLGYIDGTTPIPKIEFSPSSTDIQGGVGIEQSLTVPRIQYYDGTTMYPKLDFSPTSTTIRGNVDMGGTLYVPTIGYMNGTTPVNKIEFGASTMTLRHDVLFPKMIQTPLIAFTDGSQRLVLDASNVKVATNLQVSGRLESLKTGGASTLFKTDPATNTITMDGTTTNIAGAVNFTGTVSGITTPKINRMWLYANPTSLNSATYTSDSLTSPMLMKNNTNGADGTVAANLYEPGFRNNGVGINTGGIFFETGGPRRIFHINRDAVDAACNIQGYLECYADAPFSAWLVVRVKNGNETQILSEHVVTKDHSGGSTNTCMLSYNHRMFMERSSVSKVWLLHDSATPVKIRQEWMIIY